MPQLILLLWVDDSIFPNADKYNPSFVVWQQLIAVTKTMTAVFPNV
ncbi:MAG: hypothetical protein RML10_13015 [Geminocystis sp.]|nr:hypothetical protein [Geminocystis sp.]MDW8464463.1 hypothetical protein [Geminocystis sp.]